MKRLFFLPVFFIMLLISGCANMYAPPLDPGATEEEVITRHGKPTARYQEGNQTLLEYAGGYWAQYAFFATLDSNGRLIKWEQVRTDEKFSTFVPGQSTKADLLKTIGHPSEISFIRLNHYEVWSYRYKKALSWDMLMHFMFNPDDATGTLQYMESGIDLLYDAGSE